MIVILKVFGFAIALAGIFLFLAWLFARWAEPKEIKVNIKKKKGKK